MAKVIEVSLIGEGHVIVGFTLLLPLPLIDISASILIPTLSFFDWSVRTIGIFVLGISALIALLFIPPFMTSGQKNLERTIGGFFR